ncbi:hypothetical protein D3C77_455550 [compost metagenome]
MVQPAEIFFFLRTFVMQLGFISFRIDIVFTVIWSASSQESRVGHRDHDSPVICTQGQRNRRLSVRSRMFRIVFFQYVFIILQGANFRITEFLQYTVLDLETASCIEVFVIDPHVRHDGIDGLIFVAVFQTVHVFAKDLFNVRRMLIYQIGQIQDESCIY